MAKQPKFKTAVEQAMERAAKQKSANEEKKAARVEAAPQKAKETLQSKIEAARAKRESMAAEYNEQLGSGQVSGVQTERTSSDDLNETRYPHAIHYNPAFHDELAGHISEIRGRITALTMPTKSTKTAKDGTKTEYYRDPNKSVLAAADNARHHLRIAEDALANSRRAHLVGSETPASITAVADFSRAVDAVHDAHNTLTTGLKGEGRELFTSDRYEKGFASLGGALPFRLSSLARAYTGSVAAAAPLEMDDAIRSQGNRTYVAEQASPTYTAPPAPQPRRVVGTGPAKPSAYGTGMPADLEKAIEKAKAMGVAHIPEAVENLRRVVVSGRDARKEAADSVGGNFDDIELPPKPEEPALYNPGEGAPTTSSTIGGAPSLPYRIRWAREAIRNEWQSKNPEGTFIGSNAYNDPEGWHLKEAVKKHFYNNGGKEEDYEGSLAEQDPQQYREAFSDPSLGEKRFKYRDLLDERFPTIARRGRLIGSEAMPTRQQSIEAEAGNIQEHPETTAKLETERLRKEQNVDTMTKGDRREWERNRKKAENAQAAEASTDAAAKDKADVQGVKEKLKKDDLGPVREDAFAPANDPKPRVKVDPIDPVYETPQSDEDIERAVGRKIDTEDMSGDAPSEKLAERGESGSRTMHFRDASERAKEQQDVEQGRFSGAEVTAQEKDTKE